MATSSTTTNEQKILDAIAFLREAGRDDEAAAVESTLSPAPLRRLRRSRPAPPDADLVPIAEAAERLGLSPQAVQRRIGRGLLEGERNPENGYQHVTRESLEETLDIQRILLTALSPLPGELDEPIDADSLLGQMLAEARRIDDEQQ